MTIRINCIHIFNCCIKKINKMLKSGWLLLFLRVSLQFAHHCEFPVCNGIYCFPCLCGVANLIWFLQHLYLDGKAFFVSCECFFTSFDLFRLHFFCKLYDFGSCLIYHGIVWMIFFSDFGGSWKGWGRSILVDLS